MKQRTIVFLAGALLALAQFGVAAAEQFEDGVAALKSGDYATALRLLRPLAEQGNAEAQVKVGSIYGSGGHGVVKDTARGAFWTRRAAEQGNVEAQYIFGLAYEAGIDGVPQEFAQAALWLRKAAEQENEEAQRELGELYQKGLGVPKDYARSVSWFRKAANHGNRDAQFDLGEMFESGAGVLQDYIQAYMWFNLAASPRDSEFAEINQDYGEMYRRRRDRVAAKMTPGQIAEAHRLAREWKPTK